MSDDTAYIQDYIDHGERIPPGAWRCPGGLSIPGDYCKRARAAGRIPDAGDPRLGDGYWLAAPESTRLELEHHSVLPGWVTDLEGGGDTLLGRDGCAMIIPVPQPLGIANFTAIARSPSAGGLMLGPVPAEAETPSAAAIPELDSKSVRHYSAQTIG